MDGEGGGAATGLQGPQGPHTNYQGHKKVCCIWFNIIFTQQETLYAIICRLAVSYFRIQFHLQLCKFSIPVNIKRLLYIPAIGMVLCFLSFSLFLDPFYYTAAEKTTGGHTQRQGFQSKHVHSEGRICCFLPFLNFFFFVICDPCGENEAICGIPGGIIAALPARWNVLIGLRRNSFCSCWRIFMASD